MSLAQQLAFACRIKEATVATAKGDDPGDIPPIVIWERQGKPIAVAQAQQVDRDEGLEILHRGRVGFGAKAVSFFTDAHQTQAMTNPTTGKPWGPNEMQELCDHAGACDLGLLSDCIAAIHYDGEQFTMTTKAYHVDKAAHVVHWSNDGGEASWAGSVEGLVPNAIRAAFDDQDLINMLTARGELPPIPPGDLWPIVDRSTCAALKMFGARVIGGEDGVDEFIEAVARDGVPS